MPQWIFDDHGWKRSAARGITGVMVDIVMEDGEDKDPGFLEGTFVRIGKINGGVVAVLYYPNDPPDDPSVVHSVWWVRR